MALQSASLSEWSGYMPLWLILIIVGVVLAVVGFGGVGQLLIWIGVVVLIVGAVLALVGRSRV
jgi:hypothetical protein